MLDNRLPKLTEEDEELDSPIPVAPDLVVEVHSPSDTEERRHEKLKAYQQAGVSIIWSIHMLDKFVLVYYKDQRHPQLRTLDDVLDAGTIIPGFTLPVKDLFTR